MPKRGKFIVFEGGDGAGKSTQAHLLAEYLKERGNDVVLTKEPGGIKETLPIRELIFNPSLSEDGIAQLLLFAADRRVHLLNQIVPALEHGMTVICDRYYGSTRVYQEGRGVKSQVIKYLENLAISIDSKRFDPDITVLIDVDPEVALERKSKQGNTNYFDEDDLVLQRQRRKAYLELARELNWKVTDGSKSEDEVFKEVRKVLKV